MRTRAHVQCIASRATTRCSSWSLPLMAQSDSCSDTAPLQLAYYCAFVCVTSLCAQLRLGGRVCDPLQSMRASVRTLFAAIGEDGNQQKAPKSSSYHLRCLLLWHNIEFEFVALVGKIAIERKFSVLCEVWAVVWGILNWSWRVGLLFLLLLLLLYRRWIVVAIHWRWWRWWQSCGSRWRRRWREQR